MRCLSTIQSDFYAMNLVNGSTHKPTIFAMK